MKIGIFIMLYIILFTGCSDKMIVEPTISTEQSSPTNQIRANLIGKKTFLPEVIVKDEKSLINIDYIIYETYDINGKDTDVLNLFNPLLLVGFPLGDNLLLISSNLKIVKNNIVIKEYNSKCLHTYTRNLFTNPDFTSMRNECLKNMKDNINSQIINHIKKGDLNEVL